MSRNEEHRERIRRRMARNYDRALRSLDRQGAAVDGVLAALDEIDAGARRAGK